MAGCGHLVSLATRMADLLAVAPAAAIPQNEGGLKSAQTCLAGGDHSSFLGMTRLLLRAIDFGASAVFMALCVRAFCVPFYKDTQRELRRREVLRPHC